MWHHLPDVLRLHCSSRILAGRPVKRGALDMTVGNRVRECRQVVRTHLRRSLEAGGYLDQGGLAEGRAKEANDERLFVRQAEAWVDEVGVQLDGLRKVEDVLVKERHLDIGMGIVEVDGVLKCPTRHRDTDAGGEVCCDIALEVEEQDEELAVSRREGEACGIEVNHGSTGRGE